MFRKSNGSWTESKSMGNIIGTDGICPVLTYDGKYLFFLGGGGEKITYWVDTSFVEDLRKQVEEL